MMNQEMIKQELTQQTLKLVSLLTQSLKESRAHFARTSSPKTTAFFSSFLQVAKPTSQKLPPPQPQTPILPKGQTSKIPTPIAQTPITQAPKVLSPKPVAPPIKPRIQQTPPPQPILPVEPSSPILLDLERSHLLKLLPKKRSIEPLPVLDLKKAGVRFTERKAPLPKLQPPQAPWLFGISSAILQSPQLKLFIENIQKAVQEQLQQPVLFCAYMQPLGLSEIAAQSLKNGHIFLFAMDAETELTLKILKKIPAIVDNTLHQFIISSQTPADIEFKRTLWSTLKNYASR